jgi:hypothetical protein
VADNSPPVTSIKITIATKYFSRKVFNCGASYFVVFSHLSLVNAQASGLIIFREHHKNSLMIGCLGEIS